ncbi:MAG: hypothetical protein WCC06_11770 [Candidatus Aminicenantales bacterium]
MNSPSKFLYFPDEVHFIQNPRMGELWWKIVLDWLETDLKRGNFWTPVLKSAQNWIFLMEKIA